MSMIGNLMDSDLDKFTDEVIVTDALYGLKGACAGYLAATLESATPEVRRMFGEYLNQCIETHATFAALAVKRGWYKPYLNPEQQIEDVYKHAEWSLNP